MIKETHSGDTFDAAPAALAPEISKKSEYKADKIGIFVAWPYASGERHIGHAAALVPADALARYYRSVGSEVLMVSGTDEYGTPSSIAARKVGVEPQEYVNGTSQQIRADFKMLGMSYDRFTRTTTPEHREDAQEVFRTLVRNGFIKPDTMLGSYDAKTDEALPDRFVEGECPHCSAHSRGDQCDGCSNMLDPHDLINPVSAVTGNPVEFRDTEHYFLELPGLVSDVRNFLEGDVHLRDDARRFSLGAVDDLRPRSITRDMEWGVPLPEELELSERRVMYVWFEAVIGYISAAREWAEERGTPEAWRDWWQSEDAKHYYALGKDNVPFHTLILPAMLEGMNKGTEPGQPRWRLPDVIASTGNLNFAGGKFSSSRGNVVYIRDLVDAIGPDALRYYCIAAGPENKDAVYSNELLASRVNDELIAKWGNLVSRTVTLIQRNNGGEVPILSDELDEESQKIIDGVREAFDTVGELIGQAQFSQALKTIMERAGDVNKYIYDREPWKVYKNGEHEAANQTMAVVTNAVLNLNVLFAPFIPHASQRAYELFGGTGVYTAQPEERTSNISGGIQILTGDYEKEQLDWGYSTFDALRTVSGNKPHLFKKVDPTELGTFIEQRLAGRKRGAVALSAIVKNKSA